MAKRRKKRMQQETKTRTERNEVREERTATTVTTRPQKTFPKSLSEATAYYKTHAKLFNTLFLTLLILIPLLLAVSFRSYPADLKAADIWAENTVRSNIKNNIATQVNQQYPNLPATNKELLVNKQYKELLTENPTLFQEQVDQTAAFFKSRMKNDNGQTYLIAIDPYQYLRYVENILDHGHPGDTLDAQGRPFNTHKFAPIGINVHNDFHTWVSAAIIRIARFFNPDASPMALFFWVPVLFASLAVIPAFFIGHRAAGNLAGFVAAVIVAVHSGFIGRTAAGFADTDAYVIFFPLLVTWFFIEAFETPADQWKRQATFLGLAGATFGLFAFAWSYWWFFFDVFVVVLIAYALFLLARTIARREDLGSFFNKIEVKAWLRTFVGFLFTTGVFVSLVSGFNAFIKAFSNAFSTATGIKAAVNVGDLWPNVLTTVAELNIPSIKQIVTSIGGELLFTIALMGVLATMISREKISWRDGGLLAGGLIVFLFLIGKGTGLSIYRFLLIMGLPVVVGLFFLLRDKRKIDVKYALFLIIWLAAAVFTMTKGVRFVLLLIPPFAIAAGICAGSAYQVLKRWLTVNAKFSALWVAPLLFLLLSLIVLWQPVMAGKATGMQEAPSMEDAWWSSLSKIKAEAAPDAIINSWWDFGHWFKYVADRAVTFDGASQNTPMAHWVGKALLTSDEREALGILRMLDCGSYLGVTDVKAGLPNNDDYTAVMLTKEIILLPPKEARERLLAAGISEAQAEVVLNHTHCEPPEDYFITSGDMVGKAGVWGHFGAWDFAKADAYKNLRKQPQAEATSLMEEKYGWSAQRAADAYYKMQTLPTQEAVNTWISPWPGYAMTNTRPCDWIDNSTTKVHCTVRASLGKQQGTTTVLDEVTVNLEAVNETQTIIRFYDDNGRAVGENTNVNPNTIVIVDDEGVTAYEASGNQLGMSLALDVTGAQPQLIFTDPLHAPSMFTRLFFFDGAGTTAFEKFSDETTFTGVHIIVWKVDWSRLEDLGLA